MDETVDDLPSIPPGDSGAARDPDRRKILVAATGIAGGAALAAVSAPFITSMTPSERARAVNRRVARPAGLDPAPH